ncbi:MAG: hypothetical protein M1835_006540 [Candelina submexicana]|nr:MAG: hypothetical protein M1835_006540 [Candelina submexicana]
MHTISVLVILAIAGPVLGSPASVPPITSSSSVSISSRPVIAPSSGGATSSLPSTSSLTNHTSNLTNGTSAVPGLSSALTKNPLTPILTFILKILSTVTDEFPTLAASTNVASGAGNLVPRLHARQLPTVPSTVSSSDSLPGSPGGVPGEPSSVTGTASGVKGSLPASGVSGVKGSLPAGGSSSATGFADGVTSSTSGAASSVNGASVPVTSTASGAAGGVIPNAGSGVGTIDANGLGLSQLLNNLIANIKYYLNLQKITAGIPA